MEERRRCNSLEGGGARPLGVIETAVGWLAPLNAEQGLGAVVTMSAAASNITHGDLAFRNRALGRAVPSGDPGDSSPDKWDTDGDSLLPYFKGRSSTWKDVVICEHLAHGTGSLGHRAPGQVEALVHPNLENDRGEFENLAGRPTTKEAEGRPLRRVREVGPDPDRLTQSVRENQDERYLLRELARVGEPAVLTACIQGSGYEPKSAGTSRSSAFDYNGPPDLTSQSQYLIHVRRHISELQAIEAAIWSVDLAGRYAFSAATCGKWVVTFDGRARIVGLRSPGQPSLAHLSVKEASPLVHHGPLVRHPA